VAPTCTRDPDMVTMWYYSGEYSDRWLADLSFEELSDEWAQTIAYMATARLERPFCHCGVLTALAQYLQLDLARSGEGVSYALDFSMLRNNKFGTRRGEVMAWNKVNGRRDPVASVAVA